MKAPSCVCPLASPSQSLLLIYNSDTFFSLLLSFSHLYFHLSSGFRPSLVLSSSRPPSSLLSLFPPVVLCTCERPTGPLAATQRWIECVSVLVRVRLKSKGGGGGDLWHYLYSFKLHQATCRPLFYGCNMRYLTYRCHKAQQTRGRGTSTQRQPCMHMLLRRADGWVGDRCMWKLREVFMVRTRISHPG